MKFLQKTLGKGFGPDMPLVSVRDIVVFPGMVVPVFATRRFTVEAIQAAMASDRRIFLVTQKTLSQEPREEDFLTVGCVGVILQMIKLPDETVRILVEGQARAAITTYTQRDTYFRVEAKRLKSSDALSTTILSLMRTIEDDFKVYVSMNKKVPPEVVRSIERATDSPNGLIDLVCAHIPFKFELKAEILSTTDTEKRLKLLAETLFRENEILALQQKISGRVRKRIEKGNREYFLREQIKEINRELGQETDDLTGVKELEEKLNAKNLPEEAKAKVFKELRRLEKLQIFSPEAGILRTYAEWFIDLPWNEKTDDIRDIEKATRIMDEDHYGLRKPKDRILDFIAVRQLKDTVKGPILCLVGPPGTGKTSLGKSVARCLGRHFVRMSLGGVRDEAEIRGHRKTYVGALPGKILQSMRKSGSVNPVFLLDEIDKMSNDFRGDPASALLEVLDPEQNSVFMDHYLEVSYDLSKVMFITTANSLHAIPYPLRDRMEVIEIPGYTEYEKMKIAEGFLLPKQIAENGLAWARVHFRRDALREIIHSYTMESGVRGLEREIAHVIRKIAREAVRKGYAPGKQESSPVSQASPPSGDGGADIPAAAKPEDAGIPGVAALGGEGEKQEAADPDVSLKSEADSPESSPAAQDSGPEDTAPPPAPENTAHAALRGGDTKPSLDAVPAPDYAALPRDDGARLSPDSGAALTGISALAPLDTASSSSASSTYPQGDSFSVTITAKTVFRYLGNPPYKKGGRLYKGSWVGLAYGLAWTEAGGTLLPVEAAVFEGPTGLILTGSLGDVMKESALTAFSYLKSQADKFKLSPDFYRGKDIHIHAPEGAIPKDGPSAGITMTAAMLSSLSGLTVNPGFAMTGEITLAGRILPVGGIKEKVLAAHRSGIERILLPKENDKDIDEIPKEVTSAVEFFFADTILDALRILFPPELFRAGN
jgi:ATP-dependent Lon protease